MGGYAGVSNSGCETEALKYFGVLARQTRTATTVQTPVITTPPVFSAFAGLLAPFNPSSSTSATQPSTTASSSQATSTDSNSNTNTNTNNGMATSGTSNSQSAKMVEMLIIAGITLATIIILFWIWIKYGRRRYPYSGCEHHGCDCSKMKKMWDGMRRPILYGKAELDAEKRGLVAAWPKVRRSEESGELDGRREMRELESRERRRELSAGGRDVELGREKSEGVVSLRGAAGDRRSGRTILAELDADADAPSLDPMLDDLPTPDFLKQMKWPVPVSVPAPGKRAVIVGQGEQGVVVRGKNVAVIVQIGKRVRRESSATATIQSFGDVPHIPPQEIHDCDEDSLRTKRLKHQKGSPRIGETKKNNDVNRKEESSTLDVGQRLEGESCASPFGNSVSISSGKFSM